MLSTAEVRRYNARVLVERHGNKSFCLRLGISKQQLWQYIGRNPIRNFGDDFARRIEREFGCKPGWLDEYMPERESVLQDLVEAAQVLAQTSQIENLRMLVHIAMLMRDKQNAELVPWSGGSKHHVESPPSATKTA